MLLHKKILLAIDEPNEMQAIKKQIISMDGDVIEAANITETKKAFRENEFVCVIIHLRKRPSNSLEICSWIRSESAVPIIAITSREEKIDEHMALRAGASDYMLSPVEFRILAARVHQQLSNAQTLMKKECPVLKFENINLDSDAHKVSCEGQEIPLTNTEYQILHLMMQAPTHIFSREEILKAIGVSQGLKADHLLDTHISRARMKISKSGGPKVFHAVRSVGFKLAS